MIIHVDHPIMFVTVREIDVTVREIDGVTSERLELEARGDLIVRSLMIMVTKHVRY